MKYAYFQIPELTEEQFLEISKSDKALDILRVFIEGAEGYTTCFAYKGKIYHTDTNYGEDKANKIQLLYHNVGKIVENIPTQIVEKEVVPDGMVSQQLLLKAISAVAHPLLNKLEA